MNTTDKLSVFPVTQQVVGIAMITKNTFQLLIHDIVILLFRSLHLVAKKREVDLRTGGNIIGGRMWHSGTINEHERCKIKLEKAVKETLQHLEGIGSGLFRFIPIVATVYYGSKWGK